MMKCIGGFQVMLPLLDQLTVEKVKDGDQDLFERDFGKGKSCCREQVFY